MTEKNRKNDIGEEAKSLIRHLKNGLFSHVFVSGDAQSLDDLYIQLIKECKAEGLSTSTIAFTEDDPSFSYEYNPSDILVITGLEVLPPMHNRTFSLRSWLDVGQYSGLKSFIFCEESKVREHFNDYKAPFYHFGFHHKLFQY